MARPSAPVASPAAPAPRAGRAAPPERGAARRRAPSSPHRHELISRLGVHVADLPAGLGDLVPQAVARREVLLRPRLEPGPGELLEVGRSRLGFGERLDPE